MGSGCGCFRITRLKVVDEHFKDFGIHADASCSNKIVHFDALEDALQEHVRFNNNVQKPISDQRSSASNTTATNDSNNSPDPSQANSFDHEPLMDHASFCSSISRDESRSSSCRSASSFGFEGRTRAADLLPQEDILMEALNKALQHSGNLVCDTLQVRALQAPKNLEHAYQAEPTPDLAMPQFDAKIDPDNLLEQLPAHPFRQTHLMLQRISFMGTEWLGIRLILGTSKKGVRFCMCAAALQNEGRNTSRSVVIEACNKTEKIGCFACAPNVTAKRSQCRNSWFDRAEDINELADIFLNEACHSPKKFNTELKKWTQRPRKAPTKHSLAGPTTRRRSASDGGTSERRDLRAISGKGTKSPGDLSETATDQRGRHRSASVPNAAAPRKINEHPLTAAASWIRRMSFGGTPGSSEDQATSEGNSYIINAPLQQVRSPVQSDAHRHGNRTRRRSAPELGYTHGFVGVGSDVQNSGGHAAHDMKSSERQRRGVPTLRMMPILVEEEKEAAPTDEVAALPRLRRHSTGSIE